MKEMLMVACFAVLSCLFLINEAMNSERYQQTLREVTGCLSVD